ncbi:MAG: elongation factor G [Deltaproteobacteria bacterium HGW-Deltaproteobacteria-12]|jgi:elongation factor G|nr:MAG: elongation factor G [Deltaproteobacteria bacterium HGW-Deltaproteobacteria-12]
MAKFDSKSLRNLAVVGHGGTGKTSLCESLLFVSGKSERLGRVDDATSVMDYDPEEQKRRISISSAVNFVEWNKHKITFIDTPGDSNFAFDIKCSLSVVDNVAIVIDAVSGVEFQTQKVWELADEFNLPRMIFVNRMDRERANFSNVLDSIKDKFKKKVTPVCLPIGAEAKFSGIIDLINFKAYLFSDNKGIGKATDIPAELMEEAKMYRDTMVEDIAEADDALMNKYLEQGELSAEEINAGLKKGVVSGSLIPLICGSAIKGIGVTSLLDLAVSSFRSPADCLPMKGKKPGTDTQEERKPAEDAPFSAIVFKTIADPYAGRLTLFRIYSGKLSPDSSIYNSTRKIAEKFGHVFFPEGKNQKQTDILIPGDIAGVAKLKETVTGDTLCAEKAPIIFAKVAVPHPVMSFAIEPKTRGDEDKIASSIHRLTEEDPAIVFSRNVQTKEMILSGMGQVHIEVNIEKMKRKFGVEVNLNTPKVPYLETIKGKIAGIQGKHKKQSGGHGQFGDCTIDIEPLPRGAGFEFADKIVGGVIPGQYRPAVEKGIVEAAARGVLAGYPVVDFKVSLVFGSYHAVDSSEMAFKIAGSLAFQKAIMECQPILLEPIVTIDIEVPDEYMGDVIGDLNSRRGRVLGMDTNGSNQVIKGQVPLAEILKYAPDLRSMTSGRGNFTYTESHYEEVPAYTAEKIIAESKKDKEE